MKNPMEKALNFMLRAIFGTICICLINSLLAGRGLGGGVGVNPFSVLTAGALGLPGVALLYGIQFYFLL